MGDYSQGHFRFTLKKDSPKDVLDNLRGLIKGQDFFIGLNNIYLGDSAYHHMPTFAEEIGPKGEEDVFNFSLTFQIKFGCDQLDAFAEWLEPYVVVDDSNQGFFGYRISEYNDTVTSFIARKIPPPGSERS